MTDATHHDAVDELPPHLEVVDKARLRCTECGMVGMRPLACDCGGGSDE